MRNGLESEKRFDQQQRTPAPAETVMAGLDPAIHAFGNDTEGQAIKSIRT
jgi:hypothetical protein